MFTLTTGDLGEDQCSQGLWPLTWAELAGKALGQSVPLRQALSEALPLVAVRAIVGEEVLEVLLEQDRVIFPIPQCLP